MLLSSARRKRSSIMKLLPTVRSAPGRDCSRRNKLRNFWIRLWTKKELPGKAVVVTRGAPAFLLDVCWLSKAAVRCIIAAKESSYGFDPIKTVCPAQLRNPGGRPRVGLPGRLAV